MAWEDWTPEKSREIQERIMYGGKTKAEYDAYVKRLQEDYDTYVWKYTIPTPNRQRARHRSISNVLYPKWKQAVAHLDKGYSINYVLTHIYGIKGGSQYKAFKRVIEARYERHKRLLSGKI